jgi:mono/diheme cytochrome c family protein
MRIPFTASELTPARLALAAATGLAACGGGSGEEVAVMARELPPVPAEHAAGERLYAANCASCHGVAGVGTQAGPPLVHRVYEPSHHADFAFRMAVTRGVVAHHWRFGNMPPQPQVAPADVAPIVGYVRWLQRQAGIE